jgi:hypothetical protein
VGEALFSRPTMVGWWAFGCVGEDTGSSKRQREWLGWEPVVGAARTRGWWRGLQSGARVWCGAVDAVQAGQQQ